MADRQVSGGFTADCDCPDDAAPYEPCECCGTPIARYGLDHSWVEDNMQRGCPVDSAGVVIGHCRSWTTHTPRRCRAVRLGSRSSLAGFVRPNRTRVLISLI